MDPVVADAISRSALANERAGMLAAIGNQDRASRAPLGYDRFVLFSASAALDDVVGRICRIETGSAPVGRTMRRPMCGTSR